MCVFHILFITNYTHTEYISTIQLNKNYYLACLEFLYVWQYHLYKFCEKKDDDDHDEGDYYHNGVWLTCNNNKHKWMKIYSLRINDIILVNP